MSSGWSVRVMRGGAMRVSTIVHDPAGHNGSGQCQRCLRHTSRDGRPKHGRSTSSTSSAGKTSRARRSSASAGGSDALSTTVTRTGTSRSRKRATVSRQAPTWFQWTMTTRRGVRPRGGWVAVTPGDGPWDAPATAAPSRPSGSTWCRPARRSRAPGCWPGSISRPVTRCGPASVSASWKRSPGESSQPLSRSQSVRLAAPPISWPGRPALPWSAEPTRSKTRFGDRRHSCLR